MTNLQNIYNRVLKENLTMFAFDKYIILFDKQNAVECIDLQNSKKICVIGSIGIVDILNEASSVKDNTHYVTKEVSPPNFYNNRMNLVTSYIPNSGFNNVCVRKYLDEMNRTVGVGIFFIDEQYLTKKYSFMKDASFVSGCQYGNIYRTTNGDEYFISNEAYDILFRLRLFDVSPSHRAAMFGQMPPFPSINTSN